MELIDLENSDIILLSQKTLLRLLTFLLGSLTVILPIVLFKRISIFHLSIYSLVNFPSLRNSDHVSVPSNSQTEAFHYRVFYSGTVILFFVIIHEKIIFLWMFMLLFLNFESGPNWKWCMSPSLYISGQA